MDPVSRDLLAWYEAEARVLPWRSRVSPWGTLVSELMLQQTRVDTVIPYYLRFMERFPTPDTLAEASVDELLGYWSGLGYYSRARNLHKAATAIRASGGFPADLDGLRALPGVGAYTAGAIGSIALGLDAVAVDGNLERVLSRLHRYSGSRDGVTALARAHLPPGRAGDYNQALMDLGATVCLPKQPRCGACPIHNHCEAYVAGDVGSFPVKTPKKKAPEVRGVAGALLRGGRVLLARRPETGLLGGLYELPGQDPIGDSIATVALMHAWKSRLNMGIQPGRALGSVRHIFTHRRLDLAVIAVSSDDTPMLADYYTALAWVDPRDPGPLGLSTLASKALALLGDPQKSLPW